MAVTVHTPGLLTARDLELAAWLDRLAGASVDQLRRRFRLGRTQAYRRLQVLADHGLVVRRHLAATMPPLYAVPQRSLRLASCAHALASSELIVTLERSGRRAITELELRRERAAQARLGGVLSDSEREVVRGCARLPDAAQALPTGGLVAYEIELSSKGARRRERIISAYAASAYERVVWIAPDPRLARLLTHEIDQRGLAAYMEVIDEIDHA